MDAFLTAHFFQVSRPTNAGQRDLIEILEEAARRPHLDRERDIQRGTRVRIERFRRSGDFASGELARIQKVNVPPYTTPEGLAPIPMAAGRGMGHMAAFRYHIPTRILLLQRNSQGVSSKRLELYAATLNAGSFFSLSPVLRSDSLARLDGGDIRSLKISFANPNDLAVLENENLSGIRQVRELAATFNSPEIELTLKVGRSRDAHLNRSRVRRLVRRLLAGDVSLNSMRSKIALPEGVETVDLLNEALIVEGELELTEGNPDANYQERSAFIRSGFNEHIAYLQDNYGNPGEG